MNGSTGSITGLAMAARSLRISDVAVQPKDWKQWLLEMR